jgi:chemotaxis protein CheX
VKVEFVNPFIDSAQRVLNTETGFEVKRGALSLHTSASTTRDVTTLVAVTGKIHGIVMISMSNATAMAIVSAMIGQQFEEVNDLAISGIAELGNVITGTAGIALAETGYPSKIAPPIVVMGAGTKISTVDIQRLLVVLSTPVGEVDVQVAIKEAPNGVGGH